MEIKPRHIWIIGVGLWLIAVVSAKIWPPKQSYLEWQHGYNMELMLLHSDVHRAELLNK